MRRTISTNALLFAALIGTLLAGIAVDRYFLQRTPDTRRFADSGEDGSGAQRARAVYPTPTVITHSSVNEGLIRAEAARGVHEALDERAAHAAAESSAAEGAKVTVPNVQNVAAFDKADAVLESAIAANRWTPEDRAAFREALRGVTREQHRELKMRLARGINERNLPYTPGGD